MSIKTDILNNLCYTDAVYARINKKLGTNLSRRRIEELLQHILAGTDESNIIRTGKNYYISAPDRNIRITINSYTYRVITADKLDKNEPVLLLKQV